MTSQIKNAEIDSFGAHTSILLILEPEVSNYI